MGQDANAEESSARYPTANWLHSGSQKAAWEAPSVGSHENSTARDRYPSPERADGNAEPDDALYEDKTLGEHLADLQHMMDACTGKTGKTGEENEEVAAPEDPLQLLRDQCRALRDEVSSMVSVKQEMESDLRDNVQRLQERIETQCQERVLLKDRLLDAKEKMGQKRQEMADSEMDFHEQVAAERAAKEQLQLAYEDSIQSLQSQLVDLNRQVEDDWDTQVATLQELDAETDSLPQYQVQLQEERARRSRQNPGAINDKIARHNEELMNELETEELNSKEEEAHMRDEHHKLSLKLLEGKNTVTDMKQELLELQRNRFALEKWAQEHIPEGVSTSVPESSTAMPSKDIESEVDEEELTRRWRAMRMSQIELERSQDMDEEEMARKWREMRINEIEAERWKEAMEQEGLDIEVESGDEAANDAEGSETALGQVWNLASDLEICLNKIELKKEELDSLNEELGRVRELESGLHTLQAEQETEVSGKDSLKEEEQALKDTTAVYQKAIDDHHRMESLIYQVHEQKITLDSLRTNNNVLLKCIRGHRNCCFKPKAPQFPARPRVPPPDLGRGKGREKGKGTEKGKAGPTVPIAESTPSAPSHTPSDKTPQSVPRATPSDRTPSDRAPSDMPAADRIHDKTPESVPLVSFEEGSSGPEPEQKVQWKIDHVFVVCKVGEEAWVSGSQDVPTEVSVGSIAEAVKTLNEAGQGVDDCYLVQDMATEGSSTALTWYCIWRRGRKGASRKKMERYLMAASQADNMLPARSKSGSSKRERSRPGRLAQQVGDNKHPDVSPTPSTDAM